MGGVSEDFSRKENQTHVAKPGYVLPISGMGVEIVSADGAVAGTSVAAPAPRMRFVRTAEKKPADQTENARSLGMVITFEKTRIIDLGDLTWDKEMDLVCPVNKLGHMDVFIVGHHGLFQSNSPALVDAISPRIAIMDNGESKGGSPSTWDIIKKSPKLEDSWQLHFSKEGGSGHNSAEPSIANLAGVDSANYLKLTVNADGSLEVFNSRTQTAKHYAAPR